MVVAVAEEAEVGGRVRRGDIFWVNLGPALTHAPSKRHPVVVVQADEFNRSNLGTVIVAAVTSNTALAVYPGNVFLPGAETGLVRDSVANVTALLTLDKRQLEEYAGTIPHYLMDDLSAGLRLVLRV